MCSAPVCRDLAAPLDGKTNCQTISFPRYKYIYCSVNCDNSKVLFNATGKYGVRGWECGEGAQWTPTEVYPDCVGRCFYMWTMCEQKTL